MKGYMGTHGHHHLWSLLSYMLSLKYWQNINGRKLSQMSLHSKKMVLSNIRMSTMLTWFPRLMRYVTSPPPCHVIDYLYLIPLIKIVQKNPWQATFLYVPNVNLQNILSQWKKVDIVGRYKCITRIWFLCSKICKHVKDCNLVNIGILWLCRNITNVWQWCWALNISILHPKVNFTIK
jgi:hypothetical protein